MKPDVACANHPDSEGFFQCRYCGENFCERCCRAEGDFHLCRKPGCAEAFQDEAASPPKVCPHCDAGNRPLAVFCQSCGRKIPDGPGNDPDSPVTVGRFAGVTEAGLARAVLASRGIESFIADEAVGTLYSGGNTFLGGVRLQTRAADAPRALQILYSTDTSQIDVNLAEDPAGSCRYCGEIVGLSEIGSDSGPLHCQKPQCLDAYQAEMKSLARSCPSCGISIHYPQTTCAKCGTKVPKIQLSLEPGEKPLSVVVSGEKWDLRWAVSLWLLTHFVKFIPATVYSEISYWKGVLPNTTAIHAIFWAGDLACLFLVFRWTQGFLGLSWREALRFLGYKRPDPRQLLAGAVILIPLLTGFFLSFNGYQKEGALILVKSHWAGDFVGYLLGAGLLEETFYRGFLFRFLRRGRSFLSAAVLSSGLWALAHLAHLIPAYGPEHESFGETSALIFGVFLDGIMAAFLFERGGNNIWGWMLVHLVFDNCYLVEATGADFYVSSIPKSEFDAGHWISLLLTIPVTLWIFPKGVKPVEKSPGIFQGNKLSVRWNLFLRPVLLASAGVLAVFLATAQGDSEIANRNHWRQFMDSHPRYADGYRKWAYDLWTYYRDSEAEEKCQAALAIDPKNYKAWLLWGKILKGQERYADAAEKFKKSVECAPRNAAPYLWWGYVLEYCDKKEEAIEKYRAALSLKPEEVYLSDFAQYRIDRLEGKRGNISSGRYLSY